MWSGSSEALQDQDQLDLQDQDLQDQDQDQQDQDQHHGLEPPFGLLLPSSATVFDD